MSGEVGSHIDRRVSDGVQCLVFNRPDKKNALTSEMYGAMARALREGGEDPDIRVHLILGAGGVFSAGNDLRDFMAVAQSGKFDPNALAFLKALTANEKPIVAAVGGPAVGVGTTLLLHCDLVYASPEATFRTPFIDLGLVPEAASSLLMPLKMGHQRAFEMLCMGTVFDAERALSAGLLNAVYPAAELEARARDAALALAKKPQAALLAARRLMRRDAGRLDGVIDEEIEHFKTCLRSAEAREAFQAFMERRPPDFEAARAKASKA